MKKLICTAALLLSMLVILAQRVDLDKYNFNASYIDLPRAVIDTSYKTFFVEFGASSALRRDLEEVDPEELVYIEGWKRLPNEGHVKIFTRMEDVFIENFEVKERVEILKDKNGKETGRKSYYYVQIAYSFDAETRITDYKGNSILTLRLANRDSKQTYNTKEFSSFIEASLYYKFRGIDFPKEIAKRAVRSSMNQLANEVNYNFGYSIRTVTDFLWILDSKKHPEYDAHRKAWLQFRQAMFQMNAEEPLDEVKTALIPVIAYYDLVKKRYTSDSKADKKMRYASHFNLAKIYYYLDNPDAAMREAGELVMNEYDEKDGRRLEAAASDLKMLLKQNKFTTRHFSLNVDRYNGPGLASGSQ